MTQIEELEHVFDSLIVNLEKMAETELRYINSPINLHDEYQRIREEMESI